MAVSYTHLDVYKRQEETDVVEEVAEAEKEREIKETLETMEAEAAVEKS